ncbi:MAG: arylsulfatase [Pirellula sp.]|jgi:arylsulfatase A-like enzyme|nr:arylsulfatase [Pirellula sp.]
MTIAAHPNHSILPHFGRTNNLYCHGSRRFTLFTILACLAFASFTKSVLGDGTSKPNLIWIMADDLGYGELGCFGQTKIKTPHLDQMAKEGMTFTKFYAGATVCAPSRSVLMTGQHHGHTRVRGNAGPNNPQAQSLVSSDKTVAYMLKNSGYRTGLSGKWGLGDLGAFEEGLPRKQGFDEFFGFLNQTHAHNHYPDFLWRNEDKVPVENEVTKVGNGGGGYATKALTYADDLIAEDALRFVRDNQNHPFFLYWSLVVPHANNERTRVLKDGAEVPDYGIYHDEPWTDQTKGHAAMISRMDQYVGTMLKTLRDLNLAENTLVIFTSDNGPHNESNHDLNVFQPSGPLRGLKRSLTDGGIRVPMIAWWPTKIAPASKTEHVAYFGDWMATCAELAGFETPNHCDSISFIPTLLDQPDRQSKHEFLYWEFHEGGFRQAALYRGRWKGIRTDSPTAPLILYDQSTDIGEEENVASSHPDITSAIEHYLDSARTNSHNWPPIWKPK